MAFIDALVKHEPTGEQTDIFWEVKEDRARALCIHYLSIVQKFFDSSQQTGLIQLKFTDDHPTICVDESNQFLCIIGYKPDQSNRFLALKCPLFVFLVYMIDCAFAAKLYDYYPDVLKAIRGEKQMHGLQQIFFNGIMTRFREYPPKLLFELSANGKKEYDLDDVTERTLVGYLVEKMSTEQINHLYFVDNGVYRDLVVWIIKQRLQQQEDAMKGKSFIDKEGLRGAPSEPLCINEFANFPFTAHSSLNMPK